VAARTRRGPDLALLWRASTRRFDLERSVEFIEQTMNGATSRARTSQQADVWTWQVMLALTRRRLARGVLKDARLPWHRPQRVGRLTPSRVRQGVGRLLPSVENTGIEAKIVGTLVGTAQRDGVGARRAFQRSSALLDGVHSEENRPPERWSAEKTS